MRHAVNVITLLLLILLAACGQKGPLFLPGDPSQIQSDPQLEETAEGLLEEATEDDEDEAEQELL